MANITKTVQTELQAMAQINANASANSSVLSVSTHLAATVFIDFAPVATTAIAGAGTRFQVQVSEKDSGDDTWRDLAVFQTPIVTANSSAVDGTEAAGATVIEEATTTGLAVGDKVFFKNSTLGNSEWSEIVAITASTSFTIRDGLTNAQTGSTWFNKCEHYVCQLDLTAVKRLRVVANNNLGSTNRDIVWRVAAITGDSIT